MSRKDFGLTIHWVSPLPTAATDIANYTLRIVEELAAISNVVLWTDASTWDSGLEEICKVRQFDPDSIVAADWQEAGLSSDPSVVFINIGNSWVHHSGMLRLAHRVPSIVVLHDLVLQELFIDAVRNGEFSWSTYEREMVRWYGAAGKQAATDLISGKVQAYDVAADVPGFEVALGKAVAVLCHTPASFHVVSSRGLLPCYELALPFKASAMTDDLRRGVGPLRLVQFGFIGPNRRLQQVLEALADLDDELDFKLRIIGEVWDQKHIEALIEHLNLSNKVEMLGFVDETILDTELQEADLVFNLRHPTMGEASGSQLRIWNAGAASVVTDDGWYGTLPENVVIKVPRDGEREALREIVLKVARNRHEFRSIREGGRQYFIDRHQPEKYVQEIIAIAERFAEDVRAAFLARALSGVVDNFSKSAKPLAYKAILEG
jgi:glycosyltransferase involved in cell wall biosynthesis